MEPEAYTVGWQPFLGLKIWLDSRPLIPRPETEWWVEQLLTNVGRSTSHIRFLDLCAGSGAIGCAALKYLSAKTAKAGLPGAAGAALREAEVWFGELDGAHEATIQKNIEVNGLNPSQAHVAIGDLFAPFPAGLTFDVIACNPPYVPEGRELPASVANYEPTLALRAGADGLAVIRRIAAELPARLAPGGVAWIECDAEHAEAARAAFGGAGLHADIMHDQYKRPRIITVSSGQ